MTTSCPDDILWRQKAAFSDAVGHSMVDDLKEYAESRYTDEEFERRCAQYTFARPFTKESLLYREIFEKYYPGQAEMVKDFWMPNQELGGLRRERPVGARACELRRKRRINESKEHLYKEGINDVF